MFLFKTPEREQLSNTLDTHTHLHLLLGHPFASLALTAFAISLAQCQRQSASGIIAKKSTANRKGGRECRAVGGGWCLLEKQNEPSRDTAENVWLLGQTGRGSGPFFRH